MRLLGLLAGTRASARSICSPSGCRGVERDRRAWRTAPRRSRASRARAAPAFRCVDDVLTRAGRDSAARELPLPEHAASATRPRPRRSATERAGGACAATLATPMPALETAGRQRGGRSTVTRWSRTCWSADGPAPRSTVVTSACASPAPAPSSPRSRGPAPPTSTPRSSTALAAFESGVWSSVSATDRGRVLAAGRDAAPGAGRDVRGRRGAQRGEADRRRPLGGRGRGRDLRVLRRRREQALRRGRAGAGRRDSTSCCASRSASAR